MADSNTTTYSFTLPEVGASADSWGTKLNANWDKVDDLLDGSIAVNGITVTGGSIDGTPVGATTPSTGEFTTVTTTGNVDVTGTVSADGLTVDTGGTAVILNHSATGPTLRFNNLDQTVADGQQLARIEFSTDDGGSTTDEAYLQLTATGGGGAADFDIMTGDGTPVRRARFGVGGDIQFYEDTGTTAKFVWDASAESLGIGTSSPSGLLTLNNASGAAQLYIKSGNSNDSSIIFGAQDDAATGSISYFHSDDSLRLNGYNNTERMRIDSSGNLLVGKTSPNITTLGIELHSSNYIAATADGQSAAYFTRKSSDGDIALFRKDGTTVGSIGTTGGALDIKNAVAGGVAVTYENSTNALLVPILTNGSFADGLHDLGRTNARFKDLYLSGGVYLGGTGSANKLDDYEEGTWAVALTPTAGGTISLYGSQNAGQYTKVGRIVTVNCYVSVSSASGASGELRISLPFVNSVLAESGSVIAATAQFIDASAGYSATVYPTILSNSVQYVTMQFNPSALVVNDKIALSMTYISA